MKIKSFIRFLTEQEQKYTKKDLFRAIDIAKEANEYPRVLQNWPISPEEAEAEEILKYFANKHNIAYKNHAASVWQEIYNKEVSKDLGSITQKLASSIVKKMMGFVKNGELKKAYFCLNLLRQLKFQLGVDPPTLPDVIENAKIIGVREFDPNPLSIEKMQDIIDRTMAYIYTVDFNSDVYPPLRAKAKITAHLGKTKERLPKNIYEIEFVHYPKKKMKAYDLNEKTLYSVGDEVWVNKEKIKIGYEKPFYTLVIRENLYV
ncbi:MAG: hypothetical protein N3A54_00135 [Patescibacteria group bacterium]|nr:hypothetical protein [Patescibacteria group bacterium]